jgi:hypothetical protein
MRRRSMADDACKAQRPPRGTQQKETATQDAPPAAMPAAALSGGTARTLHRAVCGARSARRHAVGFTFIKG